MGASMLTSYIGDRALIKSFMGDLAKDSFGKVVATNSAREWFLGNLEGSLQNMSAQIGKNGSIKSEDEWLNAGIMEGFAQKGIAAGVLTADALSRVVAKDYDGKPVTYKQIIDGTKTFDPKTIDKSFNYGTGVNLGDAIGYHSTFLTNPNITPDEYFYTAQTFRQNGMNDFTPQEITSIAGGVGELSQADIGKVGSEYAKSSVVTIEEARQMMRDLGYTNFTDQEAMSLTGKITEADAKQKAKTFVDAKNKADADAKAAAAAQAAADKAAAAAKAAADAAALAAKKAQEAATAKAATDAALKSQADANTAAARAAQLANASMQANLDKAKSDILAQVAINEKAGMTRDAALQKAINTVAATQKTDTASLLSRLGTTEAALRTQITTQISGLDTKLTKAIADARAAGLQGDAALKSAIDRVAADQKVSSASILSQLGKTEAALKTQFATELSGVKTQISDLEKSLSDEIQAAKDIGLQGDAALQAGLNSLSSKMGINQTALLRQLGTTEATLRTQFGTQISGLDTKLTAAIADAKAAGLQGDAALKSAIDKVAADQKVTSANLLTQLGKTEADLKAQFSTQLGAVQTQVSNVQTALTKASNQIHEKRNVGETM
jgi:hypothetical protein